MRKPIFIIFNDMHLTADNGQAILASIDHMLDYAKKIKIKDIVLAGDALVSRSAQRLNTLESFEKIISKFSDMRIDLHIIPGNHDKTDYKSVYSFLEVYRYHSNVTLYRTAKNIQIEDIDITLVPFFDDEILIPMLKEAKESDILISHFEMLGSENLGKKSEKDTITKKLLKKWKKTYLGHYHDTHEITEDIIHLPSLRQAKFSENTNKGFTVIYSDLSYVIIKGKFREFIKVEIDLDKVSLEYVKEKIQYFKNSDSNIRFDLSGSESKLNAFDKSIFNGTGIQVKTNHIKEFEKKALIKPEIIKKYDKKNISEKLKVFCKEKGYNYEDGAKYFDNFMKGING